jgi:hypothetical protein
MSMLFMPDANGFAAFLISCGLLLGCTVLGAAIGHPRRRFAPADPVVGLGCAVGVMILGGVLTPAPLSFWACFLGLMVLVGAIMLVRRGGGLGGRGQWLALVALLSSLLIMAATAPTNWDEFMQWLPNAAYLYRYDSFPHSGLAPSVSAKPAYPYAGPLFIYLVSLLTGRFTTAAGGLLNLLLLAVCAPILVGVIEEIRQQRTIGRQMALSQWQTAGLIGLAVPAISLLSPGFDGSFALTALADVATAVVTATSGVLLWLMLERLTVQRYADARALAWQFGFVAVLLVTLRQPNPVILALLLVGAVVIAVRDQRLRLRHVAALLPAMLVPGLIVYVVWRTYAAIALPDGDVSILPPWAWNTGLVGATIAAMMHRMAQHPAYFMLMFGLSGLGMLGLWRMAGALDRLLVLVAVIWLGYTVFLLLAYLVAFQEWEARSAAEYWRYSTHIALLGTVGVAALATRLWPRGLTALTGMAVISGLGLFPVATALNANRLSPDTNAEVRMLRQIGSTLAETLPDGARVAVMEPTNDALLYFVLRYELWRPGRNDRGLRVVHEIHYPFREYEEDLRYAADSFANRALTHIVIGDPTADFASALGIPTRTGQILLLQRGHTSWQIAQWWPRSSKG